MKIRIDENYTTLAQVSMVQEAIKDFKRDFKYENDLVTLYQDNFGTEVYGLEVVSVDVEAFPLIAYDVQSACAFNVHLLAKGWCAYAEIDFFVHNSPSGVYTVAQEANLHSMVVFERK